MSEPSVNVNGGAAYCFDLACHLGLDDGGLGASVVQLKNDGGSWGSPVAYATTKPWTLAAGPSGPRKVWARYPGIDNLCVNPSLHVNLDGWHVPAGYSSTRMTSPPQALPDGADACIKITATSSPFNQMVLATDMMPVPSSLTRLYIGAQYTSSRFDSWGPWFYAPVIACYDDSYASIGSATVYPYDASWPGNGSALAWRDSHIWFDLLSGTAWVTLTFQVLIPLYEAIYLTNILVSSGDVDVYATIDYLRRPNLGGEGVDVLDASWTSDIHAGFQSATLTVLPPRGVSLYADSVLDGVILPDLDQHALFEGRVEEPDVTFTGDDKRDLECTGFSAYLQDDETFRRCYVDSSVEHWKFDQIASYASAFSIGIEDTQRLVMRVAADLTGPTSTGVPVKDGEHVRMYWELFDGALGDSAETIQGFKFHYQTNNVHTGTPTLTAKLYGRDKLSGGSIDRLLWTAPATSGPYYNGSGNVSLDATDIGSDITCLVFILGETGDCGYAGQTDPTLDTWDLCDGISITLPRVYGSACGAVITPEGVVADLVNSIVDSDHTDFPDASGMVIGQLYFDQCTTIADAIAQVNSLLDWSWGFDEGSVFFYRKPWEAATAPDVETIVVSMADPLMSEWSVRLDYAECCNKVVASYQATPDKTDTVTVSETDGPLGDTWRVKYLDLTGQCDDADTALAVATRYLADNLWPKPTGSCTLKDAAHLACGLTAKAIHAKPGMMLYNMDVPVERGGGRLLITSVDGSLLDRAITLNVGVRSNRMDRWLSALELKAKAVRRRRARR